MFPCALKLLTPIKVGCSCLRICTSIDETVLMGGIGIVSQIFLLHKHQALCALFLLVQCIWCVGRLYDSINGLDN